MVAVLVAEYIESAEVLGVFETKNQAMDAINQRGISVTWISDGGFWESENALFINDQSGTLFIYTRPMNELVGLESIRTDEDESPDIRLSLGSASGK